jgi:autotransporter-associated beta strand protein
LVKLGSASTISSDAGRLNLTNAGTITGATFGLTLTGAGDGSIASIIGTTTGTLTKSGPGTWTLSGANTYTGVTTVSAGTLQFAREVSLYNDVTTNWTAAKIVVAGTLALNVGGTGEFTSSDVTTLVGLGTATGGFKSGSSIGLDTTNAAGGNFTYSSAIANPNGGTNALGLTKLGAGSLTLSAANTYTGGTIINGGTLLVNGGVSGTSSGTGTGIVTVNSGGTLGGSGAISGAVTVNSGGHLAPGNSPGILHSGALTLSSGSFYNVDLNGSVVGTGYDQVIASSLTIAGANLAFLVGGTLNIGDHLFIALNSGSNAVTGTFAGLGEGASVTSGLDAFTISYAANGDGGILANDIMLTVTAVPEPSTWLACCLSAIMLSVQIVRARAFSRKLNREPLSERTARGAGGKT